VFTRAPRAIQQRRLAGAAGEAEKTAGALAFCAWEKRSIFDAGWN